jgi:hypothetical protein
MKRKIFTLLAAIAVVGMVNAQNKSITIKKATDAITLDGVGDEASWTAAAANAMDQTTGVPNVANFKMTYDDKNLYVLVSATDATPNQDGASTWQSDCIELMISMDTANSSAYRAAGDMQIRKIASKSQADGGVEKGAYLGDTLYVEQADGATYAQEWEIPWAGLEVGLADAGLTFNGKDFRFETQNGDNDGSGNNRTGQSFWNTNHDNTWNSVKDQGFIVLAEPIAAVGPVSVKNAKVAASTISIKANYIDFSVKSDVNVYDITGKLVLKANNVNTISTAALKNGVYVVSANNEAKKFIK